MATTLRQSTLATLDLGDVIDMFERGTAPASAADLVDIVFGNSKDRGSLVVSGANGIVGAGKTMQLGSRLAPHGVPIVALDVAGAPDGLGRQYPGLVRAFGRDGADNIMQSIVRLTYDGKTLPESLRDYKPRFLLEAIPEILDLKRAHYEVFRKDFPEIEIRSVTSGFPSAALGVGIAHPAFPHEINKVFEIVEPETTPVTQLLWSLGLIPIPVSDNWSFVLDVLFCGLTLAAIRYHHTSNMPYWKVDKYTRRLLGPNPFRAHDAIGAKGANFLTWSCLHHLGEHYGGLFTPASELVENKDSGVDWYPPNHLRPLVNWTMDDGEDQEFRAWILGALIQMTTVMLKEERAHLAHMNIIGELCAQFNRGIIAQIRSLGREEATRLVESYHLLHPDAASTQWYPDTLERMSDAEWQQLYVNAEHKGGVGVLSIGRESYNTDVDEELNRAIDWLKHEGIDRVIVTGDFHLATQLVGADTTEFFAALDDENRGYEVSHTWTQTARRLNAEFETSVGFIGGKRCWGGCLELLLHCHYIVAADGATMAFPEVTLPVVPGMEGCHWPFRRTNLDDWPRLVELLLSGQPVTARDAVGWLIDFAGPMNGALETAWQMANQGDHGITRRPLDDGPLKDVTRAFGRVEDTGAPDRDAARQAIIDTIRSACEVPLSEAAVVQARRSAAFMAGPHCRKGAVGGAYAKVMTI